MRFSQCFYSKTVGLFIHIARTGDFRRDALSIDALQEKLNQKLGGKPAFFAAGVTTPVFVVKICWEMGT